MSHLQYFAYPGYGHWARDFKHHHQVVKVDNQLIMSGQVGLDRASSGPDGIVVSKDIEKEMDQAFENVDVAFKEAGGKGTEQVYKFVVYLAPYTVEASVALGKAMKKWFPNHKPVVTAVGVPALAYPGQRVEVDAYAHLG